VEPAIRLLGRPPHPARAGTRDLGLRGAAGPGA